MVTKFLQRTQASHQEHYEQFGVTDGFLKLRPQSRVVVGEQFQYMLVVCEIALGVFGIGLIYRDTVPCIYGRAIRKVVSFGTSY